MLNHKLRADEDAILIGRVTDDREHPQLNVRHWYGPTPKRLVLDRQHPLNLSSLYAHNIQSLIVEGGAATLRSFLEKGLWDELRVETNLLLTVNHGTQAPELPACAVVSHYERYGNNLIISYRNQQEPLPTASSPI
jgi:diaminohydroxyphosphoribosylaminopyrimidine deaminase/5-amino-6-(5-phosphoribosylamino)uracil reductase